MNKKTFKILIVDDTEINRRLLASMIQKSTDFEVAMSASGKAVTENINEDLPDLILLDIMMPEMDGYEVAKILKANPQTTHIPIIFITALDNIDDKVRAFEIGGSDYITKPFNSQEVISRVKTHLQLKQLVDGLETEVEKRTHELEQLNFVLVSALESANYYNDDDTGNHIKRVSYFSKLMGEKAGLDDKFSSEIFRFASLHDIGKVGIPDHILKKPGKLSPEEWAIMKDHTMIGYKIIDYPGFSMIAKNLVLHHHEKWDGSGYPHGLKKEEIPIEARIVAIADVYDALRSKRPYKQAFDHQKSYDIIKSSAGSHFDPTLTEMFVNDHEEFQEVYSSLSDPEHLEPFT